MAILSLLDEEQLAIIQQAHELVRRSSASEFQSIVDLAAQINFPLRQHLDRLSTLADAAIQTRAARENLQALVQASAAHADDFLAEVDRWFKRFRATGRLLHAEGHPAAYDVMKLAAQVDDRIDSMREAESVLHGMLQALSRVPDLNAIHLSPAYLADGQALLAKLPVRESAAMGQAFDRMALTQRLHLLLDEIGTTLETIAVSIDAIELATGTRPVGLELAILRGAAGKAGGGGRSTTGEPPPGLSPLPPLPVLEPIPPLPPK